MHYEQKSNWDYFCELLAVIPGLTVMFDDASADAPAECLYERVKEKSDAGDAVDQYVSA